MGRVGKELNALPASVKKAVSRIRKTAATTAGSFDMFPEGEKVLLGLSGGKDSWVLLHWMLYSQRVAAKKFEIEAVIIDPGFEGFRSQEVHDYCRDVLGVKVTIIKEDFNPIIDQYNSRPGQSYCSFCARLRRGCLYTYCVRNGIKTMALGHHMDDALNTMLLNITRCGRMASMPPVLHADDYDIAVVRPFIKTAEADIRTYSRYLEREQGMPIVSCSCPYAGQPEHGRVISAKILESIEQTVPGAKWSMVQALGNIAPRFMHDTKLHPFTERPTDRTFKQIRPHGPPVKRAPKDTDAKGETTVTEGAEAPAVEQTAPLEVEVPCPASACAGCPMARGCGGCGKAE
ncbi:hypothetical protein KIPB_003933 [Kipferlia bialata]|uniref:tRNA(Ile)-lysidine/2-thiocytidine synthase N-terminal domain-containing protein n=1 Tax=Kipferlia bialata TaxID=797122 RepID=A0A9K3CT63_9EUKA|nr:hypothetical protein KIPB_003933 [Kipferlia bialata]|eukprot:g3933.t1